MKRGPFFIMLFILIWVQADAAFPIKKVEVARDGADSGGTVTPIAIAGETEKGLERTTTVYARSHNRREQFMHKISQLRPRDPYRRKRTWAIILGFTCFFCMGIGIPRFIYGYIGEGILQLLALPVGLASAFTLLFATFGPVPLVFVGLAVLGLVYFGAMCVWQLSDYARICDDSLQPVERRHHRRWRSHY